MVDIILTSFARWDLLERTLDTFFQKNNEPIKNFYVYDDKGTKNYTYKDKQELQRLKEKFPQVTFYNSLQRVGQIKALDLLFGLVNTEFLITLEDDWECLQGGFIGEGIKVLKENPDCVSVWLRGKEPKDLNFHPIKKENGLLKLDPNYSWHGFSFGVAVKRLMDYKEIGRYGNYTKFIPTRPYESEKAIDRLYHSKGKFSVTLPTKYFHHIGDNRGIRK